VWLLREEGLWEERRRERRRYYCINQSNSMRLVVCRWCSSPHFAAWRCGEGSTQLDSPSAVVSDDEARPRRNISLTATYNHPPLDYFLPHHTSPQTTHNGPHTAPLRPPTRRSLPLPPLSTRCSPQTRRQPTQLRKLYSPRVRSQHRLGQERLQCDRVPTPQRAEAAGSVRGAEY
jgi:hypothetical protein